MAKGEREYVIAWLNEGTGEKMVSAPMSRENAKQLLVNGHWSRGAHPMIEPYREIGPSSKR